MDTRDLIIEVSAEVTNLLLEKNAAYGDSALNPVGIFSRGEWNVYAHLKEDNHIPFYIGICKNTQLNKRPFEKSRRNKFWKNIYNKHGRSVILLQKNISENDAKNLEKWLIYMFGKRINKNGPLTNITDGGEGFTYKHSKESRKKISLAKMGRTGDQCPTSKAVMIDNIRYGSMAEAAREIGVCGQTIRNRCDSKQFKNYYII